MVHPARRAGGQPRPGRPSRDQKRKKLDHCIVGDLAGNLRTYAASGVRVTDLRQESVLALFMLTLLFDLLGGQRGA